MLENIRVETKYYLFNSSLPVKDVYFFNRKNNTAYVGDTIDLTPYLIDIGNITYEQTQILSGDTLELIKKCNDTDIVVSGILNSYATSTGVGWAEEYFNIKSDANNYLYAINYIYINPVTQEESVIYSGIIKKDAIEYIESPNENSNQIKIKVQSMLNHFLEYNKKITINPYEYESYFSEGYAIGDYPNKKCAQLPTFLSAVFGKNCPAYSFNVNTPFFEGTSWKINWRPFLHAETSWLSDHLYSFCKQGFKSFDAEIVNFMDFFIKLCNGMGWDFTINTDSEFRTTLNIFNRSNTNNITTINGDDKIIEINYSRLFDQSDVQYIAIQQGEQKAGTSYGGIQSLGVGSIPLKLISANNEEFILNGNFFKEVRRQITPARLYLNPYPIGEYYFVANRYPKEDVLQYGYVSYSNPNNWGSRQINVVTIENRFILQIDAGSFQLGTRWDYNWASQENTTGPGESTYDIWFKGCYADMLAIDKQGTTGDWHAVSYDYYTKTDTFYDNFYTILQTKNNKIIKIKISDIFIDYYKYNKRLITINSNNEYISGEWLIEKCEIDMKEEITSLTLKKII